MVAPTLNINMITHDFDLADCDKKTHSYYYGDINLQPYQSALNTFNKGKDFRTLEVIQDLFLMMNKF